MGKISGDIDIDLANRTRALSCLEHIPASMIKNNFLEKHNTGVYFHVVPLDPLTNLCSIPYDIAEDRGLFKIDCLNVNIYEKIKNEEHLIELQNKEIDWSLFEYPEFTSQLIHLGNHGELVAQLKPKSVKDLSIILALIRPAKRHLVDKCKRTGLSSIENEIWNQTDDGQYAFKKGHSTSYAVLVKVHANLLLEELSTYSIDNSLFA
jgi:DNA polymerase III alpha subunit